MARFRNPYGMGHIDIRRRFPRSIRIERRCDAVSDTYLEYCRGADTLPEDAW